jgi:cytochrome c biogenesis protein CcmG, thiol:disulfide interchange protein DsbE
MSAKVSFNRFLVPVAAFALLAVVLAVGIKHSQQIGYVPSPLVGKLGPAWSLPVLQDASGTFGSKALPVLHDPGGTFGSKELHGRWYVVNVWGSWCYACRDEHQTLLRIAQETAVPIIGVDWNDDDAQARNYLAQLGNPYAIVATDHEGHFAVDWGIYAAPETFLVNPEGVVVFKQLGVMTPQVWQKEFASHLPAQLVGSTS